MYQYQRTEFRCSRGIRHTDLRAAARSREALGPLRRGCQADLMVAARMAKQRGALSAAAGGQPAEAGTPPTLMRSPAGATGGGELVFCAVDRGWAFAILVAV
ncbi:predicted protein [Chaetomium globosum CBS 148.51]|uniref:Uncharacterized protein n=1 Tax=Chaetomium globosum (strain ATCC 6205 / CBS 148.51 / DSM 1962 / NBRC 6347 / NRRL 1970) TaxID=306901 RepID=Q2H4V3_CHAGB|nr:uncharacterized protein CHGG_06312 [Chaetomium globosum CBS 148.51]EAQ89693.1 predicted protein [Chaetomium globosum CBS 148.51]